MLSPPRRPVLPRPLAAGAEIAVCALAGPLREEARALEGAGILERAGLRARLPHPLPLSPGGEGAYLAAPDQERAASLHRAVDAMEGGGAVLALRGGYGCLRLLPLLDTALFVRRAPWMVGFSDLTALLNTVVCQAELVCLHGPVLTSLGQTEDASRHALFSALMERRFEPLRPRGLEVLRPGSGRGPLMGGNLSTLLSTLGTPWEVGLDGVLLVLEDVGEPLYRLDRMLTQLAQSGRLDGLAGLLLGRFGGPEEDPATAQRREEGVWERVLELCQGKGFPVWGGLPWGHGSENRCLPLGMEAVMDSSSGVLRFVVESVIMA